MSEAYNFIEAWSKPGEFSGWYNISIKPPTQIHILIYIKNWGPAIGMLLQDNSTFRCSLPHEDSPVCFYINKNNVTRWAVIPTMIE